MTDLARTRPLVAIVGPTGVGKSSLAMDLAAHFETEIVSADSRQVYRFLDIGTAKPSAEEQNRVHHHLIDVVTPEQRYCVVDFQRDAQRALQGVWERRKLALLVGGSGYYVRAILEGLSFPSVEISAEVRAEVESFVGRFGPRAAVKEIETVDPATAHRLDRDNPRRVARALEIIRVTRHPIAQVVSNPVPALVIGLSMARRRLYENTDRRVEQQVNAGLIEETRSVLERGYSSELPVMRGLAYGQMAPYLQGTRSLHDAIQDYKYATHALIRRQVTWFRKEPRVMWYDAERANLAQEVIAEVNAILEQMASEERG